MPTLVVIKGPDEGKRFELSDTPAGVGRDTANAIRLYDTEASRRHAEFRQVNGGYALVDLASSNGTFVNSQPVKEALLKSGDQVQIGRTILLFADSPAPTPAGDLADKISMISRSELEIPSEIIKAVSGGEGGRILAQPDQVSPWLKNALANLSVMYQATQAISHILDTDQLLERIMDLIFQSIEADRGCIMLRRTPTLAPAAKGSDAGGEFEPKAVRWRTGASRGEKIAISRTITDYVLNEEKGVLVTDASQDERFSAGQSIVRFGIREALCVPMKGRHETLGVLYLDTRTSAQELIASGATTGRFTEDHLMLAIAIGHQAALALEETRYHRAMVQAERLAAVGQTIAAISHHVKNILQGLRTGSEVLKTGIQEKNEALITQGWRAVEKNQERIYHLVMDMLSYSKEREPVLEPTDVNAVVRDVLDLLKGRIEEQGVQVQLQLAQPLPIVPADPEALHRALLNIAGNALDAVEEVEAPALVLTSALEPDQLWVRITVADNGVGIPPERMPELFKPFFSTKGARGTGLGLAVSRKILREHGGDLLVQTQPGKGSRFILRLPTHHAGELPEPCS